MRINTIERTAYTDSVLRHVTKKTDSLQHNLIEHSKQKCDTSTKEN